MRYTVVDTIVTTIPKTVFVVIPKQRQPIEGS